MNDIVTAFEAVNAYLDKRKYMAVMVESVNLTSGRIWDVVIWGDSDNKIEYRTFNGRDVSLVIAIEQALSRAEPATITPPAAAGDKRGQP